MSSIILNGDTSGSITVSAPSVAGTNTVTLPQASGQLMVSGNMPAFSAYFSGSQSYTTNTYTKVQINTKNFDTANCFDSTTNYRFTPNVAGYYNLMGLISTDNGTYIETDIYKNGSKIALSQSANRYGVTLNQLVYMNGTTDYVELYAFVTTAGSFQSGLCYFQGNLVRSA